MIRIGSMVLRVDDLQRQTEFWEAALGYVRRESGESDDFVLLGPPDGQPVADGMTSKAAQTHENRCRGLPPVAQLV